MDRRRTVCVWTCSLASGDRLVVSERVVTERHVVHRSLAERRQVDCLAERERDDVGDPAGRLDVAARDCGGRSRVDQAAGRRCDLNGSVGTGGRGDVRANDLLGWDVASKTSVKLNKSLCQRAAQWAEKAGYSSLDEFIEHMIEKELAKLGEPDSKDDVIKKLKGLGYLE